MDIVLGHMKQLVWPPEAVFNLHEAKKLTFDIFELQNSYLHVKCLEFCQEFNGHGPRHVTFLVWPCKDVFSLHEAKKGHEIFKAEFGEGECHQENFLPSTKLGKEAGF